MVQLWMKTGGAWVRAMADNLTVIELSALMSKMRGARNRSTELRLIAVFRAHRITGWRRKAAVFSKPDFGFPTLRLAVFVDGCCSGSAPPPGLVAA